MNKWLKVMCLVLVLAFILPALVACNDDGDKDDNKNNNGGGEILEPPASIDGTTYNGDTFTMYSVEDMFSKKYFFADKTTGDGMNDSLYQRNQSVESALDVNLVWKAAEGSGETPAFVAYATEVQNSIKSGDAKYQLVLTHAYYALPDLITAGSLRDLKELHSISVNEEYWNKSIMEQIAYKDHYYLGYSDFNLAQTYVIAFNKSIFDKFSTSLEGNTMYDYVYNGEWTLEKMGEIASRAFEDKGKESENIYGLTGELWVPFCGFIQSSGEAIVKKDANTNKYDITWYNNKTIKDKMNNIVKAIRELDNMKETHFWYHKDVSPINNTQILIQDNRAFMQLVGSNKLVELTTTQLNFGVLPYPMYDLDQYNTVKYQSLNWAGYLCVPSNNIDNEKMVSDVVECLSYFSGDVTTYFYEKLLGLKVSKAPDDAKMLDIIWNSLCSDFGVTYEMVDDKGNMDAIVYLIPRCVMNKTQFSGYNGTYIGAAHKAIDKKFN